jgi:hypothetical protein
VIDQKNEIILVIKDNKWGIFDNKWTQICKIKYDGIWRFNKYGIAEVKIGNKYGFINKKWTIIYDVKCDKVGEFNEQGLAQIRIGEKQITINTKGQEIC